MTAILFRVVFPEERTPHGLKRSGTLAGIFEPARSPGWRVEVTDREVLFISPPAPPVIGEDTSAALECAANGIDPKRAVVVTAIPRELCSLAYVADGEAELVRHPEAPSRALLVTRAPGPAVEQPVEPMQTAPAQVETAQQPRIPTPRRIPPGGKAPVQPPPSVIVEDEA